MELDYVIQAVKNIGTFISTGFRVAEEKRIFATLVGATQMSHALITSETLLEDLVLLSGH